MPSIMAVSVFGRIGIHSAAPLVARKGGTSSRIGLTITNRTPFSTHCFSHSAVWCAAIPPVSAWVFFIDRPPKDSATLVFCAMPSNELTGPWLSAIVPTMWGSKASAAA